MVDAHHTLDVERPARLSDGLARHGVAWPEASIRPDDRRGHGALAARSPVPPCGNETLPRRDGFERPAEAGVATHMPDLSACGGAAGTLALGDIAHEAGAGLTLHSPSSAVPSPASLHKAAVRPATCSVEMHRLHRWFEELTPPGLARRDGALTLADGPGIGIDSEALRGAVEGPEGTP